MLHSVTVLREAVPSRWIGAVLCLTLLVGREAIAGAQEAGHELGELVRLLEARDASLPPYEVEFESRSIAPESIDLEHLERAVESPGTRSWTIRWQQRRGTYSYVVNNDRTYGDSRRVHAIWDGATFRQLTTFPAEANPKNPSRDETTPTLVIKRAVDDDSYYDHRPAQRGGLESPFRPWSAEIKGRKLVRVCGRERLGDRDCLKIAFENGPPPSPGEPLVAPLVYWFDDRDSLLAIRSQYCVRVGDMSKATRPSARLAVELDGVAYETSFVRAIYGFHGRPPRLVLPHHVVQVWFDSATGGIQSASVTTFDPSSLRIDDELDPSLTELTVPEGTRIVDARDFSVSVATASGPVPAIDREFRECAESVAREDGVSIGPWPALDVARAPNGCGAFALALAATLHGVPTLPDTVTAQLPEGERMSGRATAASLVDAARSLGLFAVAIEARADTLTLLPRNFLALVKTPSRDGNEHGPEHWVVAAPVSGNSIRVVSPPEPAGVVPLERFESTWTGACLVLTRDAPFELPAPPLRRRVALGAGILLTAAGVLVLVLRRRLRRAESHAGLAA